MNGTACNLKYFPINNIKMEVPFFQRPYVWTIDNWKVFLNSIVDENNKMPFIGSFIFQEIRMNSRTYSIIDGQQRLTTMFVMIKAYLDVFLTNLNPDDASEIKRIILIRKPGALNSKAVYESRLIPSAFDKPSFKAVMDFDVSCSDPNEVLNTKGQIADAYLYFYNEFKNYENKVMFDIGQKILSDSNFYIIIDIDSDDDVQKIFDSVNSLGQKLTCADIIKNYLFQKLRSFCVNVAQKDDVINIYNENWEDVFYSNDKHKYWIDLKSFGKKESSNLDEFLKDFAIINEFYSSSTRENGKKITLEVAHKRKINSIENYDKLVDFIHSIKKYANAYYDMLSKYNALSSIRITDSLNTTLLILSELGHTTFTPAILKYYVTNPTNLTEFMKALQKFVLGTVIYGTSTKNFNRVAEMLVKKRTCQECVEFLTQTFNQNMINKNYSFNEFPDGIRQIPDRNNYQATLLLYIIEMIKRNGIENRYPGAFKISELTLEHIMPQDNSKWNTVPAFDFDENGNYVEITDDQKKSILRNYKVYSLGNMTLLTGPLNSSIGNEKISIKIDGDGSIDGIRKYVGSLNIAKEVVDLYDENPIWNEKVINKRAKKLFDCLNNYYGFTNCNVEDNKRIIK